MAELRALVESLGFTEVSTLIQSGNVVLTAERRPSPERVLAAIEDRFGFAVPVAVRSRAELAAALTGNPFPEADPAGLHIGFLARVPPAAAVAALEPRRYLPERFHLAGSELYLHLPDGVAEARLPAYLERTLAVPVTLRNWKTSLRLLGLVGG